MELQQCQESRCFKSVSQAVKHLKAILCSFSQLCADLRVDPGQDPTQFK